MTIPQFTDPAPPPAAPTTGRKLYNQWGQYLLPDPDTGKERAWVRATTMAKALEDTYNLEIWGMRMVAKGMALRPDLVAMAATLDPAADRDKLNKVAKDAKEAAGGSSGANMGTALHSMTEKLDLGEAVDPGPFAGELAAYQSTMADANLLPVQEYMERIICVPELGVAGRLDKLLDQGDGLPYQVGDLKSQKSMDFGGLGIAVQLSLYAHAYAIWDAHAEEWTDPPPIDQVLGTVIWLPVGQRKCFLYDVDLVQGWEWAKLSMEVRRIRKYKPVTLRESTVPAPTVTTAGRTPPGPTFQEGLDALAKAALDGPRVTMYGDAGAWALVFKDAKTVEELTQAGKDAAADLGGQLPAELKELGRELRAKLLDAKASKDLDSVPR